jgi:hypothetical protein
MSYRNRLAGGLTLLLALGVAPTPSAVAFTLPALQPSGSTLGWNTHTITFDVNYTNCPISTDALNASLDAAMALWNGVPSSSVTLVRGATVTTTTTQALAQTTPGNPVITCDTNFSSDLSGADANVIPGVASNFQFNANTLRLHFAALTLNAQTGKSANIANVSATVLSVIVAHEMGHVLGLGHSADPNALMYYDASAKTQLALSQDDVDGITYLYTRQEPGNSPYFACGSLTQEGGRSRRGSGPPPGSGVAAAQFALLLLFCAFVTRFGMKRKDARR